MDLGMAEEDPFAVDEEAFSNGLESSTSVTGRFLIWIVSRRAKLCLFYCFSFFLLGTAISCVGPMLEELALRTGRDLKDGSIGLIVTARSVGYLLSSLGAGLILDRNEAWGNRLIVMGLFGCSLSIAFLTQAYSFVFACLLLVFQGFAMGELDVCGNVLLIKEFENPKDSEPYMQALHASFAVGAAVTPIFVTKLMVSFANSFNVPLFIIAASFAPTIAYGFYILTLGPKEADMDTSIVVDNPNENMGRWKKWGLVGLFCAIMCLYVGSEVGYGLYIFTVVNKITHFDIIESGWVNTVFWSAFALGRILSILVSVLEVSPKKMVLGSIAMSMVFAIFPVFLAENAVVIWICVIGMGLAMAPTFPSVYNLCSSYIEVTGRISSAFVIAAAFGEMSIPAILGLLFKIDFRALFPTVAICCFLGLICCVVSFFLLRNMGKIDNTIRHSHLVLTEESFSMLDEDLDDL